MIHHTANKGEIQPKSSAMILHKANGINYRLIHNVDVDIRSMDSLPNGQWLILGPVSDLTESQASEIVEKTEKGFMSYDLPFTCSTALESLQSLLTFHGLNKETTLFLKSI